jgi:hypothetical protein
METTIGNRYKDIYTLIFEARETCDLCNKHFKKIGDIVRLGDLFVHQECRTERKDKENVH